MVAQQYSLFRSFPFSTSLSLSLFVRSSVRQPFLSLSLSLSLSLCIHLSLSLPVRLCSSRFAFVYPIAPCSTNPRMENSNNQQTCLYACTLATGNSLDGHCAFPSLQLVLFFEADTTRAFIYRELNRRVSIADCRERERDSGALRLARPTDSCGSWDQTYCLSFTVSDSC